MKVVCLTKNTRKRTLVDTNLEPGYQDIYLKEDGSSFLEAEEKPEPKKKVIPKKKATKKGKKKEEPSDKELEVIEEEK